MTVARGGAWPPAQRLGRAFFRPPAPELAPRLLGCTLVLRRPGEARLALRLVEVEAYGGEGEDPASHAHGGPTPRSRQMFATCGTLYVYLSYGVHHCLNVVCGAQGHGGAVLLRAAEPLEGLGAMARRRGRAGRELADGPGKLGQALGADLGWDGSDLVSGPVGLWPGDPPARVVATPRVGISRATRRRWRFVDGDSPHASRRALTRRYL